MAPAQPGKTSLDFDGLRPFSPFMTERHHAWRQQLRVFIDREVAPHLDEWDKAGTFPDSVYDKAIEAGLYGMGFPAHLGGTVEDADLYHRIIFAEEFHRLGSGVVFADLATHWIGLPPVITAGNPALIEDVAKPVLAGKLRIAFAITEPSGGSDVANMQTTAARDGDHYVLNGAKTMISGAMRADVALLVARTGGPGMGGLSLLLADLRQPGVSRAPVPGTAWYNKNIGTIRFDNARVPAANLIGVENQGFAGLAGQLNVERFSGIGATLAMSRACLSEAIAHAQTRQTFGKRLIDHQAIRHKLVEMVRMVHAAYGYLDQCAWQFSNGQLAIADLALLKITGSKTLEHCAREAMQVLGSGAYTGPSRVERIYREARTFAIGGGTEEILMDLAGKQLRF
ncbi:MAG: acyl-CoA dehydrogenase family protein [Sphingomonadales bacterium]